ncbi:tetratricopeptide repeat protein [Kaarinaea lacus]
MIKTKIIPIAGFFVLIAATYLAYSGISNQQILAWDDILYILKNEYIRTISFKNLVWMFTDQAISNWHPITWLSYAFNYTIWGTDPYSFKFLNVTIHIFNSILVYFLTIKVLQLIQHNIGKNPKSNSNFTTLSTTELSIASIIVAILFASHPLHVESVSWIAERKDVLSAFFFIAAIIAYLKYKSLPKENNWLLASIILYICSLMSKPMGVTLPVILILLDIYLFRENEKPLLTKASIVDLFKDKVTFIILSFLVSIITIITQWIGIEGTEASPLSSRIINACMSIILYLYNFIAPINLSPFYPFHHWSTDPSLYSLIPVAVVLAITGYFVYLYKKEIRFPIIAWLYFLIALLPVVGIVKVGWQAAADRYTYLPMLSFYIVIGAGLAILIQKTKQSIAKTVATSLFIVLIPSMLFLQTYQVNKVWENDKTLWSYVISKYPGTATIAYENLGSAHYTKGEFRKAADSFSKALSIEPKKIVAWNKLGRAYDKLNKDDLALASFKQIIAYHPERHEGYIDVGDFYYRRKQFKLAKENYRMAYQIAPSLNSTLQRSALVDYLELNYKPAAKKLNALLALDPNDIGALQLATKVNMSIGDKTRAEAIARKILSLNPKDSFAIQIMNELYSENSH